MRRCLDKGDIPALHDAASLWVSDSVGFALFTITAHFPFPGCGVELSRVVDVHKGFGTHDAKVREVGFLTVRRLKRRLHLERLVRSLVLEVRSRHEQPPLLGPWEAAVCEHAPNHGAQNPLQAFTYFLRCVGGGKHLDNTGFEAVLPNLLPGVPAAFIGAPSNDVAAEGDGRRADLQLKQLKSLISVGQ